MGDARLARASAWMALGTIVSRVTGLFRMLLLVAVIGTALNGDLFEVANSIPNSLYILVAGGIFNVVLVPQLVRTMKADADGGDAYANRVVTLGLLVLAGGTVVLLFAIPIIMRILFNDDMLFTAEFSNQRASARLLMILCMPQVFFYGAFVLVGQILNARGRFGPMMWAPIVNNMIAISVLGIYVWLFGVAQAPANDGFTTSQAWLLGAGSTVGIAAQALVLIPYLRQVSFRFRPRFDFRGVGLGHTLRLGAWTLAFIIVNQIAYFAIVKIATAATTRGADLGVPAAGLIVYALGFLISQVPHGIITVSVATAIIPTLAALAADRQHRRFAIELGRTMRLVLLLIAPLATALACLGGPVAMIVSGFGAAKQNTTAIGTTISMFAFAIVVFTLHYLALRGFYALEDTRTPFVIQAVIATVNVGSAVVLTQLVAPIWVSTVLAASYGLAHVAGLTLSMWWLSRRIGRIVDGEMISFLLRLGIICASAAALMLLGRYVWPDLLGSVTTPLGAIVQVLVLGGAGALVVLLGLRIFRVTEARYVVSSLLKRP